MAKFALRRQLAGMAANLYGLGHGRGLRAEERPVLVGTRSVSASEHLSELLSAAGLRHQHDRPLFGRSGRQGDPGSFQPIVSLEDEVVQDVFNGYASRLCKRLWRDDKPVPLWLGRAVVGIAQRLAERCNVRVRHELLRFDDQQSDLLAFTGRAE